MEIANDKQKDENEMVGLDDVVQPTAPPSGLKRFIVPTIISASHICRRYVHYAAGSK